MMKRLILLLLLICCTSAVALADAPMPVEWEYQTPCFDQRFVTGDVMPILVVAKFMETDAPWWYWEQMYFYLNIPLLGLSTPVGSIPPIAWTGNSDIGWTIYYYYELTVPSSNVVGVPDDGYYSHIHATCRYPAYQLHETLVSDRIRLDLRRRSGPGDPEIDLPEGDGDLKSMANEERTWGAVKALF